MNTTVLSITLFAALLAWASPLHAQDAAAADARDVYAFKVQDIDGKARSLKQYEGKVLLIVNTASKCGYTPQYESLEALYRKYRDQGFEVLGFPANNFGGQEPGSNAEIKEFCSTTYGVSFDMFAKVSVKGDDIAPLFSWLTTKAGHDGEIKWNFEKFLIGRDGALVQRFATRVDPMDDAIREAVELQIVEN